MLSCCLKCRKNKEGKYAKVVKKNRRMMLLSKYLVCGNEKKTRFVKELEACRILSCLELKAPLNKISLVGPILF